ncbi:MAG: YajQ family cyclic di-GMP-binding protein [Elusimicrobia bacterium]|nr:YajQ family cyclic di-GMP-binding protein [Elusimicrobiota bacterium]
MAEYSFDVVSKVDMNLIEEAINTALKEITNRYDFKDSNSNIELNRKENNIKLSSADEFKIKALYDILQTRMSKRGVALKNFKPEKIESALGGAAKQIIKIQQGIPSEKAKELVKAIKDSKIKVTASIQGDQLRISSKSKDDLQAVMALLRGQDAGVDLQFTNYR